MILENINNSNLYYDDNSLHYIRDYYQYVITIIKNILLNNNLEINIIVGNYNYSFNNNYRNIIININYEHTLVKQGGRDTQNSQIGKIKVIDSDTDFYLVRIIDYNVLINSNIVIDYSIPNIKNVNELDLYNNLSGKYIYIAPLLYPFYKEINNRTINCLTTFINTEEPRRKKLLIDISDNNINHININNCFDKNNLEELYKKTKIMINIHQTDHHCTFEELRVLPALLNGIIVICEDSPLKENILYNDFVIWTRYDNIINTIKEVENNYNIYYDKIFNNLEIVNIIELINKNNYNYLETNILKT
jgi:hypothetical protein